MKNEPERYPWVVDYGTQYPLPVCSTFTPYSTTGGYFPVQFGPQVPNFGSQTTTGKDWQVRL